MSIFYYRRRALTLLELLIVLFILSMLGAVALKILHPSIENSQIRESARIVSTMLGTARTRAQESNHNVSVIFRPLSNNASVSMDLSYAEAPPPYAGDTLSSRMQITNSVVTSTSPLVATITVNFPSSDNWTTQVAVNDVLQLNRQGCLYTITAINTATPSLTITSAAAARAPLATNTADPTDVGYAFQFFRQPQLSAALPVQLPAGAGVDLPASGTTTNNGTVTVPFTTSGTQPVMITFTPTGQLGPIYSPTFPLGQQATDNVYLLIGMADGAGTAANLQSPKSLWVAITFQSGLIVTEQNAPSATASLTSPADLQNARRLATMGTSMGG